MELRNQLFIDGQWCDSSDGGTFDVINPATGDAITSVQKATKDDIRKAVASARKAFESTWRETNPFERSAVIHKIGDDIAEMVELANDTSYGLAASIWTTNLKHAHSLAARIEAGTVWLNLHNFVFPTAPYAGYKASGVGSELGRDGVLALTRTKSVMVSLFQGGFQWY